VNLRPAEILAAMVDRTCSIWLNLGKDVDCGALLHTLTDRLHPRLGAAPGTRSREPGTV
jgi:hypothetical protein